MALELTLKTGKKAISDSGSLSELSVLDFLGKVSGRRYHSSIELLFMREILSGIKKIVFFSKSNNPEVERIASYLNINYKKAFLSIYEYGVLAVDIKNNEIVIDRKPRVQRKEDDFILKNFAYVLADELVLTGYSLKSLLKAYIDDIAEILQRDAQVSKNLGLLGIVCKERQENVSNTEIRKVEQKLNSRGTDFFGILASNQGLRYLKIDLPLQSLDLAGRVESKIKLACNIAGVPYILINSGGNVTYENQAEARARFYDTTIKAIGETMLELGRELIRKDKNLLIPSEDLDYKIENEKNIETK